jgi:FkbM family methyltransferase
MIKIESVFKKVLRTLTIKFLLYLENSGNADFQKNGEKKLIENILKLYKRLDKREPIIFDVGANVGGWTEELLKIAQKLKISPKVHIFEPVKSSFEELSSKFSSNQDIFLNNFGLSDNSGEVKIFFSREKDPWASVYKRNLKHYGLEFENFQIVRTERAEDYIKAKNLQHINFVKIDTEGHDLYVLLGFGDFLNAEFIDFIQFEYGEVMIDSRTFLRDFFDLLVPKGFKLAKIMRDGVEIRSWKLYMENFIYSNYIAISEKFFKYFS